MSTRTLVGEGPVLLEVEDGIATIWLNRPEASNSVDVELLQALHAAALRCHAEPGVRVVVLAGAGRNFCAGGDVKTFAAKGVALPEYLRSATAWLQIATSALIQLKAPVVAAVQGFAAGGAGFGLVCAADLVVAADDARFFSGAVRVGMAPDAGTTVTLGRIVGVRKALEILLTNPTLSAEDARGLGIVNRVVPARELHDATRALARELAAQPPLALSATKRLVWGGLGSGVEERLSEEARVVSELSGTADAREGLAAVIERRAPRFTGA
ncbi:enoyl-CoA hydratase/isomerase family protein [Nocardioides zeae]|uniref:Enoyl-CoA hydratase/isomerase family protein n=1 Tax=Nocardioides zeae TaxID=1457234 RepID=A0A6P0HH67_9ACTN|nr:enoyl-CoA hydratase-related protein [Nocardioides zeae]NEN77624.1 enoyl-CoA hydratase/isomerase family protein [Nocardioides zeae]